MPHIQEKGWRYQGTGLGSRPAGLEVTLRVPPQDASIFERTAAPDAEQGERYRQEQRRVNSCYPEGEFS